MHEYTSTCILMVMVTNRDILSRGSKGHIVRLVDNTNSVQLILIADFDHVNWECALANSSHVKRRGSKRSYKNYHR